MPYAKNKNSVAICNRSGVKMMRADMVEDGYLRGLLVHPDWYDPAHPQEERFDPDEGIAIYKPAPDLIPNPPSPTNLAISVNSSGAATITFQQPDPPASTVMRWEMWRSPVSATPAFVKVAQSVPIIPVDFFIQEADRTYRDPSPAMGGLTVTDNTTVAGGTYFYYVIAVTADTSVEHSDGLSSAPAFINQLGQTVSGTPTGTGGPPGTTPKITVALGAVFIGTFTNDASKRYIYSPDGVTWNLGNTLPATANTGGAAYGGPAGSKLWVMMTNGQATFTSPDGINWVNRPAAMPNANFWTDVCWSPTLSKFVAVASSSGSGNQVATSPDGLVWTVQVAATALAWFSVTWAPTVNLFIAANSVGFTTQIVMTSPDGITWTQRTNSTGSSSSYVKDFGPSFGIFCGQAGSTTYSSSVDGLTWVNYSTFTPPGGSNTMGAWWSVAGVVYSTNGSAGTERLVRTTAADLSSGWTVVLTIPGINVDARASAFSAALGMWAISVGTINSTKILATADGTTLTLSTPTVAVPSSLDRMAAAL